MRFFRSRRNKFALFLAVCLLVMLVSYLQTFFILPGEITLVEGQEMVYHFKSPFLVSIKADKLGVIQLNDREIAREGRLLRLSSPFALKTLTNGSVRLNLRIFGIIPLRTLQVDVIPNRTIAACGNTIGVKLKISGVLVIGFSDVEGVDGKKVQPMRQSGLKVGDLIEQVNDRKISGIDALKKELDAGSGKPVRLKFKRGNTSLEAEVVPAKSGDDEKYHLGIWARESTAGIGTLTFYDPATRSFGALGHGITDIDTGSLMPVGTGDVLESRILAVKKGKPSAPGELKGVFVEDRNKLGSIQTNCEYGIYGKLNSGAEDKISQRLLPIAARSQIREGPATILANIDGKRVEEYAVEILKVSRQNVSGSKGMVIKITDKRLLETTGGIVQGMSGSPVLQNGRLIGAVTHVLVNDPTKGYGIFIENMLKNVPAQIQQSLEKAG